MKNDLNVYIVHLSNNEPSEIVSASFAVCSKNKESAILLAKETYLMQHQWETMESMSSYVTHVEMISTSNNPTTSVYVISYGFTE